MRPIKFRGRNYVSDEWLYGSLIKIKHPNKVHAIESMEGGAIRSFNETLVNPDTVGQFTGKTDADGKEIYEGDILNLGNGNTHIFVVYWNESLCSFCLREYTRTGVFQGGCSLGEMLHLISGAKVIGNIYDNPELLSETK